MSMEFLQPADWPQPVGYSNGVSAAGRLVFVSGQVGWDAQHVFRTSDLVEQVRQALDNVLAVLAEAGAGPQDIVRMNWYLVDKQEYKTRRKEIGEIYRRCMGRHYPAMTVVEVCSFIEEGARVEIEVTAVVAS